MPFFSRVISRAPERRFLVPCRGVPVRHGHGPVCAAARLYTDHPEVSLPEGDRIRLEIGRDNQRAAQGSRPAVRSGEISLALGRPLEPGVYWAKLNLRNRAGKLIDRKQVEFRVIRGPF